MADGEAWGGAPKSQEEAEKVAAAISHPVRSVLLNLLNTKPGSGAAELARWSEQPIGRVRKQLKVLADDGLIEVQRQETRRGVVKRYYANSIEVVLTEANDDELTERVQLLVALGILRLLFDETTRALAEGTFAARKDRVVANTPGAVDERGWAELARLHAELVERVQEVTAESRDRLEASGEEPTVFLTSGVILVESPPLKGDDVEG